MTHSRLRYLVQQHNLTLTEARVISACVAHARKTLEEGSQTADDFKRRSSSLVVQIVEHSRDDDLNE